MHKHGFWQTIHIPPWVTRFIHNYRWSKANSLLGWLITSDTDKQVKGWVMRVQHSKRNTDWFQEDQLKLHLHKNKDGLYECRLYIPSDTLLTEKMVHDALVLSLHRGVGLAIMFICQEHWVPHLRWLAKKVIRACYSWKKLKVTAFLNLPTLSLPTDITVGSVPFKVVGVDFCRPNCIQAFTNEGSEGLYLVVCMQYSMIRSPRVAPKPNGWGVDQES